VVQRFGRSPWGLFWALGCFSATLTVLIPDDIVTMTLTPITIRMCQLLNLPEIPFLFSQFFAGKRHAQGNVLLGSMPSLGHIPRCTSPLAPVFIIAIGDR